MSGWSCKLPIFWKVKTFQNSLTIVLLHNTLFGSFLFERFLYSQPYANSVHIPLYCFKVRLRDIFRIHTRTWSLYTLLCSLSGPSLEWDLLYSQGFLFNGNFWVDFSLFISVHQPTKVLPQIATLPPDSSSARSRICSSTISLDAASWPSSASVILHLPDSSPPTCTCSIRTYDKNTTCAYQVCIHNVTPLLYIIY